MEEAYTNLKGKRILLLGGAGFIGHNLALKLSSYGADVTVADGFSVNNLVNLSIETDTNKDKTFSVPYYDDFNKKQTF